MNKKELIGKAKELNCRSDSDFGSFFEFASNYLMNPNIEKNERKELFFVLVNFFQGHLSSDETASVLGKRGSNFEDSVRDWCRIMLNNSELNGLSADELQYVMGYCARLAKIKKENV